MPILNISKNKTIFNKILMMNLINNIHSHKKLCHPKMANNNLLIYETIKK